MLVCTFGIFSQKLFHSLVYLSLSFWQLKLFVVDAVDHAHIHIKCLRKFFSYFFWCRLFLLMNKIFSFWEKLKKKTRQESMNNFQTNFMRISREFHMSNVAFTVCRWVSVWCGGEKGCLPSS